MGFYEIILTLANNLGMSKEWPFLILIILGSLVFYAKDVQLGLLIDFFFMAGMFILYYTWGWQYWIPLIMLFVFLILLAFSLAYVNKTSTTGGFA